MSAIVSGIVDPEMQIQVMDTLARYRAVAREEMRRGRDCPIPLGLSGTPEDTAAVVWFLLSDEPRPRRDPPRVRSRSVSAACASRLRGGGGVRCLSQAEAGWRQRLG